MQENRFKEALLNPSMFPVTWELVPGRGAKEAAQNKALTLAAQAAAGGIIHALTLTDNPGGTPAMSADFMGAEILKTGVEPLVHFTCKPELTTPQLVSPTNRITSIKIEKIFVT